MARNANYRRLDPEKVTATVEQLGRRIEARFPGSGLLGVCTQLYEVSRMTQVRAEWIARPIYSLRIITWGLVCVSALVAVWSVIRLPLRAEMPDLPEFVQALEAGTSEVILIVAGVFFFISLERRVKRGRALAAIHELRSIAHIIDMHQLTKDPERLLKRWIVTDVSPKQTLDATSLSRYLDYCSEMLSLTGKIAAVYVENFDDEVALNAVNEVETLTTGLSRKIWQKIVILNSFEQVAPPRIVQG
jgi:hypothetical protein